jgi:hypothetical protein
MENNEIQGELFEPDFDNPKGVISNWTAVLIKERAIKMATDNALRKGTLVYAKDSEAALRRVLNVVYGSLQVLLSETLPSELIYLQTAGKIRDRLVSAYNEIVRQSREALEAELKKESEPEPENANEEDDGETVA